LRVTCDEKLDDKVGHSDKAHKLRQNYDKTLRAVHYNQCIMWLKSITTLTAATGIPHIQTLENTYVNAVTIVQSANIQIFASSLSA